MQGFGDLFRTKEQEYGLPSGYLTRTAQIESSNDPMAYNASGAAGLFQFMPKTASAYGLSDPYDPMASTDAAARLARDNAATLRKTLGREPTAAELYLAHQQGATGAAKLLTSPDATVGGKAISQNGGVDGMTGGAFASQWMNKFDGTKAAAPMASNPTFLPQNAGGLGGLGGIDIGNVLGAIGQSLLTSPRNNPFGGLPAGIEAMDKRQKEHQQQALLLQTMSSIDGPAPAASGMAQGMQPPGVMPGNSPAAQSMPDDNLASAARLQKQILMLEASGVKGAADALKPKLQYYLDLAKPSEKQRELIASGMTPGTPEFKNALRNSVTDNSATSDTRNFEYGQKAPGFVPFVKEMAEAKSTKVNIDQKAESKFDETLATAAGKRWNGYIEQGDAAQSRMADINLMREISNRAGSQGAGANAKLVFGPYFEAAGIDVKDLSDVQAYDALVKRLAPSLRQPGSGSASDADLKGFTASIGTLANNPQARNMILDTFEAGSRNDLARADIATRLANKEISRTDAEKAIRALPDPLDTFKQYKKENPEAYQAAVQSGMKQPAQGSGKVVDQLSQIPPGTRYRPVGSKNIYIMGADGKPKLEGQ